MKGKIAVIANGWYNKGVCDIVNGISSYTRDKGIDLFLFLTYSQYSESEEYNQGEFIIHELPNYDEFDGVIFVPDSLSSKKEIDRLHNMFVEKKIPVVSIGVELEGLGYMSCNNYESMKILSEHMTTQHDINSIVFIAGHKDNSESNERLRAAKEVFEKSGVEIRNEDIYYCNWEYASVVKATRRMTDRKDGLPDLIMCANDVGALAVCTTLEEKGYSVPEDVLVTGFDNIDLSRTFSPSLTTLAQPYEKMGFGSAELLYEMLETGKPESREYVCDFIVGESCGCPNDVIAQKARKKLAQESFMSSERNIIFERANNALQKTFFSAKNYEELPRVLMSHFSNNHLYEGNGFSIVLERRFKQNIYSKEVSLKNKSYGKTMEVVVGIKDDEAYSLNSFSTDKLIPNYEQDTEGHTYVICSLHSRDNIFGYMVMRDQMEHIRNRSMYPYVTRMGELFDKYRNSMRLNKLNDELLELSVKDALTGLYNRLGYERIVKAKYENSRSMGNSNVIVFADINRMKYINDTFGHLQGDMAIRVIASVVQECINNEWSAVRYGGDEFVIIGECDDEQTVQYMCERLSSTVTRRGEEMVLPYKLSISSGYIMVGPEDEKTLEEYVIMADEYMYKHKKRTYEDEKK